MTDYMQGDEYGILFKHVGNPIGEESSFGKAYNA